MTTRKRAFKKEPPSWKTAPTAGRPHIPGYGIPEHEKGLLPWSHVTERMTKALHYWVSTASPEGRPHATPVDGLWLDDRLYFGGGTETRRHRNLTANPAACVHLESGTDVVILHGDAMELRQPDRSLTIRLSEGSRKKYGYGPKPEEYEAAGIRVFRARVVIAWKEFPKDATRWRFLNDD